MSLPDIRRPICAGYRWWWQATSVVVIPMCERYEWYLRDILNINIPMIVRYRQHFQAPFDVGRPIYAGYRAVVETHVHHRLTSVWIPKATQAAHIRYRMTIVGRNKMMQSCNNRLWLTIVCIPKVMQERRPNVSWHCVLSNRDVGSPHTTGTKWYAQATVDACSPQSTWVERRVQATADCSSQQVMSPWRCFFPLAASLSRIAHSLTDTSYRYTTWMSPYRCAHTMAQVCRIWLMLPVIGQSHMPHLQ